MARGVAPRDLGSARTVADLIVILNDLDPTAIWWGSEDGGLTILGEGPTPLWGRVESPTFDERDGGA